MCQTHARGDRHTSAALGPRGAGELAGQVYNQYDMLELRARQVACYNEQRTDRLTYRLNLAEALLYKKIIIRE